MITTMYDERLLPSLNGRYYAAIEAADDGNFYILWADGEREAVHSSLYFYLRDEGDK